MRAQGIVLKNICERAIAINLSCGFEFCAEVGAKNCV